MFEPCKITEYNVYQINNSQVATTFQFYTEYEKNMLFWFNIA